MFVSCAPRSEKIEGVQQFWNDLIQCVGSFWINEHVAAFKDLNARVCGEVGEGIKHHESILRF